MEAVAETSAGVNAPTRVEKLEQELTALRAEFDELKRRFDQLESQLR